MLVCCEWKGVSRFNGTQAIGESEIFELLLSTDVRWMEIAFATDKLVKQIESGE